MREVLEGWIDFGDWPSSPASPAGEKTASPPSHSSFRKAQVPSVAPLEIDLDEAGLQCVALGRQGIKLRGFRGGQHVPERGADRLDLVVIGFFAFDDLQLVADFRI